MVFNAFSSVCSTQKIWISCFCCPIHFVGMTHRVPVTQYIAGLTGNHQSAGHDVKPTDILVLDWLFWLLVVRCVWSLTCVAPDLRKIPISNTSMSSMTQLIDASTCAIQIIGVTFPSSRLTPTNVSSAIRAALFLNNSHVGISSSM